MTLDPNPKNQLGKGILAPALEAELIADGCIFAAQLPPRKGKPGWGLLLCKRLIADAVTDGELDSARYRQLAHA